MVGIVHDFALLVENAGKQLKALQLSRHLLELLDYDVDVLCRLWQTPLRLARPRVGEAAISLSLDILAQDLFIDGGILLGKFSLQLAKELAHRFDQNAQPSEAPNGRADSGRIEPLLGRIDTDRRDQLIGERSEKNFVQLQFENRAAVIPQSPLANIRIGFMANIEGIVPSDVQRDRLARLLIGQVVQLLQNQRPQCHMQILAGATNTIAKVREQIAHWQVFEQILAKHTGPTSLQQTATLRPQIFPWIKQIPAQMVP